VENFFLNVLFLLKLEESIMDWLITAPIPKLTQKKKKNWELKNLIWNNLAVQDYF